MQSLVTWIYKLLQSVYIHCNATCPQCNLLLSVYTHSNATCSHTFCCCSHTLLLPVHMHANATCSHALCFHIQSITHTVMLLTYTVNCVTRPVTYPFTWPAAYPFTWPALIHWCAIMTLLPFVVHSQTLSVGKLSDKKEGKGKQYFLQICYKLHSKIIRQWFCSVNNNKNDNMQSTHSIVREWNSMLHPDTFTVDWCPSFFPRMPLPCITTSCWCGACWPACPHLWPTWTCWRRAPSPWAMATSCTPCAGSRAWLTRSLLPGWRSVAMDSGSGLGVDWLIALMLCCSLLLNNRFTAFYRVRSLWGLC